FSFCRFKELLLNCNFVELKFYFRSRVFFCLSQSSLDPWRFVSSAAVSPEQSRGWRPSITPASAKKKRPVSPETSPPLRGPSIASPSGRRALRINPSPVPKNLVAGPEGSVTNVLYVRNRILKCKYRILI